MSGDPNEVVVLWEWDSAENFWAFIEESDVGEVMEEAGVVGESEMYSLEETESKTTESPAAEPVN